MWKPTKERVIGLAELEISTPQGTGATVWASVLLDSPVRDLYLMQGMLCNVNCGGVHLK